MKATQQLLDLNVRQVKKMTESELRQAVSTLRSTARKRYERIVESEVQSPAISKLWGDTKQDFVPFPSVRGMDETTLQSEYKRYREFLQLKTSTVKGARKYFEIQKENVQKLTKREWTDEETTTFLDLYDKARKTDVGGVLNYREVKEITQDVFENDPNKSTEDLLKEIEERLETLYESQNGQPLAVHPSKSMS